MPHVLNLYSLRLLNVVEAKGMSILSAFKSSVTTLVLLAAIATPVA